MRVLPLVLLLAASIAQAQNSCDRPPVQPTIVFEGSFSRCSSQHPGCSLGETIKFRAVPLDGSSYDTCVTFLWSFGNGTTSAQREPVVRFLNNGVYRVTVQVINAAGQMTAEVQIMVVSATVNPIVETFTVSATVVRAGEPVTFTWSTRYTSQIGIEPLNLTFHSQVGSHTFTPRATAAYRLTAESAAGLTYSLPVTVQVVPPRRRAVRH